MTPSSVATRLAFFLLLLWPVLPVVAEPGSWAVAAPAMRLAVPGRLYESTALFAPRPELVSDAIITRVGWRFELPPGRRVEGWLCDDEGRCVSLPGQRGFSRELSGRPASQALRFRFALAAGESEALQVRALQLIVNYGEATGRVLNKPGEADSSTARPMIQAGVQQAANG